MITIFDGQGGKLLMKIHTLSPTKTREDKKIKSFIKKKKI